jgi:hypothetical protein
MAPLTGVNVIPLQNPLPVRAGDLIGVDCPLNAPDPYSDHTSGAPAASWWAYFAPKLPDNATMSPGGPYSGQEELVNADVVGYPSVTGVAPSSGPPAGGTAAAITGTHLADINGVTFGGVAASSVTAVSDTQVNATAPAHAAGTVDVRVVNAAGTSPVVAGDAFTYQAPAPPPAPTPPSNAFTVRNLSVQSNSTIVIALNSPGPGNFSATAIATAAGTAATGRRGHRKTKKPSHIRFGTATVLSTGTGAVQLRITPTATARRLLRQGESLRVATTITFTPVDGTPATQTKTLTVAPKRTKHKHHA